MSDFEGVVDMLLWHCQNSTTAAETNSFSLDVKMTVLSDFSHLYVFYTLYILCYFFEVIQFVT